jgi:hypothetical protein
MAMSWAHPNFLRRHFYDSTPNEGAAQPALDCHGAVRVLTLSHAGIGFYAEELLLQQGFFDDSPHTRKTLYTYMRLRAIRYVRFSRGRANHCGGCPSNRC